MWVGGSDQIIRQLNIIAPWIPAHFKNGTYGTISDGNPIAWLEANNRQERRPHDYGKFGFGLSASQ